jgi:hypothetical protein
MSESLRVRALRLLDETTLEDKEICRRFGFSQTWLKMFKSGQIRSPGVDRVQTIYEDLSGSPLFPKED